MTPRESLWRECVHLVENADRFQDYRAGDFQALRAQLVHCVLRGVPEDVVVAVGEVDEVGGGDAFLDEGDMVVFHGLDAGEEVRLIAYAGSGLIDDGFEPRCGSEIAGRAAGGWG